MLSDVNWYPRFLANMFLPIFFWSLSGAISSVHLNLNSIFALYSFGIFLYIFFLMYRKNEIYFFHLNSRVKLYFTSYIFIFLVTTVYIYLENKEYIMSMEYLMNSIILLFLFMCINEYFENKQRRPTHIAIIGNEYKFTSNDFLSFKKMKLLYTLHDNFDSFLQKGLEQDFIVNNTSHKLDEKSKIKVYKQITIDTFLNKYLRKIRNIDNVITDKKSIKYPLINYMIKRIIDFSVVIVFIPICMIVIPIAYIILRFQSKGKFIFVQDRVGKDEKIFEIIKIRSMHEPEQDSKMVKNDNLRIFPFGAFMRKTRIDEFPQFLNVIKGHMHIAGPRAEWLDLHNDYYRKIDNYDLRNRVAPGITGFAQVMFRYGHNMDDAIEKLMFDIYYIKYWSLWLEIEIGLRTVAIILGKKGS